MIQMNHKTLILLATQPVDFRKGIDGFVALCRHSLQQNPHQDARFVFISKRRTQIRVLCYDGTGFWLMTKRLSQGTFQGWPTSNQMLSQLSAKELSQLLKGSLLMPVKKVA